MKKPLNAKDMILKEKPSNLSPRKQNVKDTTAKRIVKFEDSAIEYKVEQE